MFLYCRVGWVVFVGWDDGVLVDGSDGAWCIR